MKPNNTFARGSLAIIVAACFSSSSFAQQSASATFASPKASAAFPAPEGSAAVACEQRMVEVCAPARRKAVPRKKTRKSDAPTTVAFDPNAVHPDVAVKDTKPPAIELPGVMKIQGADVNALDFTKAQVIPLNNNQSRVVYLSKVDQNRIQLPWMGAKVIATEEVEIDKNAKSNNVYVQFVEGVKRPVQVYFEQPGGGGSVLGLQLVPKDVPAQTIIVQDTSLLKGESIKAPKGNDYVAQTQAILETVALGQAPQGYSQVELKLPLIAMNGLVVRAERLFSSTDRDIYVYDVLNPRQETVTLQEKEFDGDSVLAISIFPKPVLRTNEHSKVLVISRKQKGE